MELSKWEWQGWDFFNPFTPKEKHYYENKETGDVIEIENSFCYWTLAFGSLWYFFKGMWLYALAVTSIAWLISLPGEPIAYLQWLFFGACAYACRRDYREFLLGKGYERADGKKIL